MDAPERIWVDIRGEIMAIVGVNDSQINAHQYVLVGDEGEGVEWLMENMAREVERLLRNFNSSLDSLSQSGQRAVRAMGGLSRIGASEADLHFRRKEFTEMYAELAPDLLPPGERRLIGGAT